MDENAVTERIRELIIKITNLPASKQKPLTPIELQKNHSQLDKSMAELGIYIQYLLLDLEATTRERDQFRHMLDNQSGDET
jgi:hypothetical protein